MKKAFFEYYQKSEEEIKKLWEEGLFIMDANALLDLYRYSSETSNDLLSIMKILKEKQQLWMPHHIGYEFHKHRREIIYEQQKAYDEVEAILNKGLNNYLNGNLNKYIPRHPLMRVEDYINRLIKCSKKIVIEVNKLKEKHPKWDKKDDILDKVTGYFDGCVGSSYPESKRLEIYKDAEKNRYPNEIPPGYADAKTKPEPERFGDLIIWNQIIDKVSDAKKPIIYITRDQKEDWWYEEHGKKIGPRPELSREMWEKAKNYFFMYETTNFIKHAKNILNLNINAGTIPEIEKLTQSEKKIKEAVVSSQSIQAKTSGVVSGTASEDTAGKIGTMLPNIGEKQ